MNNPYNPERVIAYKPVPFPPPVPSSIARQPDDVLLRRVCSWPCDDHDEKCYCRDLMELDLFHWSNFAERSYLQK